MMVSKMLILFSVFVIIGEVCTVDVYINSIIKKKPMTNKILGFFNSVQQICGMVKFTDMKEFL